MHFGANSVLFGTVHYCTTIQNITKVAERLPRCNGI